MKQIFRILISMFLSICLIVSVPVFANGEIRIIVNGKNIDFDVPPYIDNGRTMVPMRAIFEALDADVSWDSKTNIATATKGIDKISFLINDGSISNETFSLFNSCEVPPEIVGGRTFVPLRAIGEILDCDVRWDESTRTVYVNEKQPLLKIEYKTEQIILATSVKPAKIVVNYTYPVVTAGNGFVKEENVSRLNQMITQQRKNILDIYEYASEFAELYPVIIMNQTDGYPNISVDIVTKLYTSKTYGTVSILTNANMPWIGGDLVSETVDNVTLAKKELHECFSGKKASVLYSEIYDKFATNYEWVRYGKEYLSKIPGVVPFVISDNDLRVHMSALDLTGVGRVNWYYTIVKND